MSNTNLWNADYYETDTGKIVGRSLAEAVAWARDNPDEFARTYIWWVRDDDAEATAVDRDIRDELAYATGEWFGPGGVSDKSTEQHSTAARELEQAL